MAKVERYRNNGIQVRTKEDGSEELRINGTVIEVTFDPSPHGEVPHGEPGHPTSAHGGYRSRYAFMHAPTLPELGQLIVDAQQSLTEPELPGLVPEKEEAP